MRSTRRSRCRRAITQSKSSESTRRRRSGMSPTDQLLTQFTEACNYPGVIDPPRVERALGSYLETLKVQRKIEQLKLGWNIEDHPSLLKYTFDVLEKVSPRDALDALVALAALAARDARDARDARAARA